MMAIGTPPDQRIRRTPVDPRFVKETAVLKFLM
jgi:hypothetical protein